MGVSDFNRSDIGVFCNGLVMYKIFSTIVICLICLPIKAQAKCDYNYLKNDLMSVYKKIVQKTNTIPKIFSFCGDKKHYLFNVSIFQKFNDGKGINRALEKDLFSFLLHDFNANSYSRTSLIVIFDQQLELVTTIVYRKPFKADEIIEEVFYDENIISPVSYGELMTFDRPDSVFAKYFEFNELSNEDKAYLEKFKPFVGGQEL